MSSPGRKTVTQSRNLDWYDTPGSWDLLLREIQDFEAQRIADSVPSADVDVYAASDNGYGSDKGVCSISYSFERPETDDEMFDREQRETLYALQQADRAKFLDAESKRLRYLEYARLKEEFENE